MLLEKDNPMKWDRLNETRIMLGEMVVMPALRKSDVAMKQKVAPLVEEWEKADSFGSPTLINQMRNLLSSDIANEESKEDNSTAMADIPAEPKEEPKAPKEEPKTEATEPAPKEVKEEAKPKVEPSKPASSPPPSLNRQSSVEEVTFDFEGSVSILSGQAPLNDITNSMSLTVHSLVLSFERAFLIPK
jgi:outer membrane biosynthesis protein TonB